MRWRSYAAELGLAIIAYGLCLWLALAVMKSVPGSAWRYVLVLLPMLPAAGIAAAVMRQIRRMDELQRRIQLEALAFGFAGTAFLTLGYGFLELAGLPSLSMFVVWPLMAALWVLGLALASRRYAAAG